MVIYWNIHDFDILAVSRCLFYMEHHRSQLSTYTVIFVAPVVECVECVSLYTPLLPSKFISKSSYHVVDFFNLSIQPLLF